MQGSDTLGVELLAQCSSCGAQQPINEPVDRIRCTNCLCEFELDADGWSAALANMETLFASVGRNMVETGKLDRAGRDLEWERGPHFPPCPVCEQSARYDGTVLRCTGCGHALPSRPAPTHLSSVDPQIVGVYATPDPGQQTPTRMAMACVSCGASLSLGSETTRQVPCTYCQTTNIISDDVWRAIHPPRKRRRFWLLYTLERDPRLEPPDPKKNALGCTVMLMLPLFFVALLVGGLVATVVADTPDPSFVQILPYLLGVFSTLSFVSWLWLRRNDNRDARVLKVENEVIGRLVGHEKRQAKVELLDPQTREVIGGTLLTMTPEQFQNLGASGGHVRAYVDRASADCKAEPVASALV